MESVISDSYSTSTLLGSKLLLSKLLPITYDQTKEFTLNTHLNILPNENLTTEPKLRYFGVGIGGAYNVDDGILSSAYNPDRKNMNLYNMIPIRCRPVDEDLTDAERANYRLRTREVINGSEYFLYYLKVLNFDSEVTFKRYTLSGTEETYELSRDNLTPTPVKPTTSDVLETDTSTITATCAANIEVTANEVLEYINARYNGDTRYAKISELGLFTGTDTTTTGTTTDGVTITYKEAIGTILFNHSTWIGTPLTHSGQKLSSQFLVSNSGVTIR